MSLQQIAISFALCSVFLFSCKKDDDTPAPTPTPGPVIKGTAYLDVSEQTVFNLSQSPIYSASAFFFTGNVLDSAGIVSVNGAELIYDGIIYYSPSGVLDQVATQGAIWAVTGANGYTAFSHTNGISLPATNGLNAGTIDKSQPYTLTMGLITGEDSVTFAISYFIRHTVAAGTTSYTFTPQEMSSLPTGPTSVGIRAVKYESSTVGNKRIIYSMSSGKSTEVDVVE